MNLENHTTFYSRMKHNASPLIFCLLLFSASCSFSQTVFEPPRLNCVKNAGGFIELYWDLPAISPCFDSYEIWYALDSRSGPYTLLTTVADPLQNNISINLALADSAYFYMIQRGTCNNPAPPNPSTSDTLDNTKPQAPIRLVNVSVVNDDVVITWLPSSTPEVVAYIVYSDNPGGTVGDRVLDTVYGRTTTTFIDTLNDPSGRQVKYGLRALEFCENPGGLQGALTPEALNHGTAYLNITDIDSCLSTASISWELGPYKYESSAPLSYDIQMNANNAGYVTVGNVAATSTSFVVGDIPPAVPICLRLSVNLPNGTVAFSNERCFTSNSVAEPETDYIRNITVDGNNVLIEYIMDSTVAPYRNIVLQRSPDGNVFNPITVAAPTPVNFYTRLFADGGALPAEHLSHYFVQVNDYCSRQHFSDTAVSLYLNVKELRGNIADIQWRGFDVQNIDFQQFKLIRIEGTDTSVLGTFGRGSSSFQLPDLFDYMADTVQDICFRITAEFYNLNDRTPRQLLESHSNVVCLTPVPKLFMPNAFAPGGFNKTIKPFLLLASKSGYKFMLFDRWNHLVFSTENVDEAWDGTYKEKDAPFDSYLFVVDFMGKDGKTYKEVGTIMLIR
jgi:gliding motility-associated-like protein